MKVSCDGCGRSYAVSDQYLGRNIRLKCKHCGATTLVRPGLPEPPPGAPASGEVVTPPASPEPTPARPHAFGPAAPDPFARVAGGAPAPARPRAEAPSNVSYLPIPARSAADGELDAAFADLGRELAQQPGEEPGEGSGEAPGEAPGETPGEAPAGQADAGGAELDGLLPASIEEAADLLRPPTTVPPLPADAGAPLPASEPRPKLAERFEDGPKEATDGLELPGRSRARPALLVGALIAVAGAAAAWLYPGAKPPATPRDAPARAAAPSTIPAPAPAQAGSEAERPAAAPADRPETPSQPSSESAPVPPAVTPTLAPAAREEPTPAPRPAREPATKKPPPVVAHASPRTATRAATRAVPRAAEPARAPPSAQAPAPEPVRIEPVPTPAPVQAERALSAAPAPAPVSSDPSLPSLGDAAVASTFARHQADFDACVKAARAEAPGLVLNRAVTVTLTVQPSGKVLYPTLDDAEVTASELGRCLKRESAKMLFPPFGGEAVRIRQRLTLR